jgi:hypothetical protein
MKDLGNLDKIGTHSMHEVYQNTYVEVKVKAGGGFRVVPRGVTQPNRSFGQVCYTTVTFHLLKKVSFALKIIPSGFYVDL